TGPGDVQAVLEDIDRGLAERAVGLLSVGQGGLFDALAVPGKEPPTPARKFDRLTGELAAYIRAAWRDVPADPTRTRLALPANITVARERVHAEIPDAKPPGPLLLERLATLQELGTAECVPFVLPLLSSPDAEVQKLALGVLGCVGGRGTADAILKAYPRMPA